MRKRTRPQWQPPSYVCSMASAFVHSRRRRRVYSEVLSQAPAAVACYSLAMSELPARPLVIVAGPTASGKSALALALAEAFGGTIINADSMQVYRDLRVLT